MKIEIYNALLANNRKFKNICNLFTLKLTIKSLPLYYRLIEIFNTFSDYITIGFEKDKIKKLATYLKNENIYYNFFLSNFYKEVWSFCNKGFFNFKKIFDKYYHS